MRAREVFYVDVVAYAGTVLGIVIIAENAHLIALADNSLGCNLDKMRRIRVVLPDRAVASRTCDVEVAQNSVFKIWICRRRVF